MTDPGIDFCWSQGIQLLRKLGWGVEGVVYETSRPSALKVLHRQEAYQRERDAYLRLRDRGISSVCGLRIPTLLSYDDDLLVVEMSIVRPPSIVDFASVWLDQPPDFPPDVIADWHERLREEFGDRAAEVIRVLDTLEREAGVYRLDVNKHDVRFDDREI